MSEEVIEGFWDCNQCGHKHIGGLTDICPKCGKPKGKDIEYYTDMTNEKVLSNEDLIKAGISREECDGEHPDWICSYCEQLNNHSNTTCALCGSPREEKEGYYNTNKKSDIFEDDCEDDFDYDYTYDYDSEKYKKEHQKRQEQSCKYFLATLLIFLIFSFLLFFPVRTDKIKITGFNWIYEVQMEEYKDVDKSGWTLPSSAKLRYTKEEQRDTKKVFSHNETKTRTVTERKQTGTKTEYSYVNNGNGTFTKKSKTVPVYENVTRTETYQVPVYDYIPVYDTKYYYTIKEWIYYNTFNNSGVGKEPVYPKDIPELTDTLRVSNEKIKYYITFDDKKEEVSELEFNKYKEGDELCCKKSLLGFRVTNYELVK